MTTADSLQIVECGHPNPEYTMWKGSIVFHQCSTCHSRSIDDWLRANREEFARDNPALAKWVARELGWEP